MSTDNIFSIKEIKQGIVQVDFDLPNSPVNVFKPEVFAELDEVLDQLERESDLKGCVFTSSKGVFAAGADVAVLLGMLKNSSTDDLSKLLIGAHRTFQRIQSLPFITAAAINGYALGGGLEYALAMDVRVMLEGAMVGLPEVGLGVIPGWGGTTRLPRVIAPELAVTWVTSGAYQSASQAKAAGLVSAIVESVDELVDACVTQIEAQSIDLEKIRLKKSSPVELSSAAEQNIHDQLNAQAKRPGKFYPAGTNAIDSMLAQFSLPLDAANEVEIRDFIAIAGTDACVNLMSVFINEQAAIKAAKKYSKGSDQTSKAAVIGAGIMGGGIAYQSALRKVPVVMKDINQEALDLGMEEAMRNFNALVKKGRMDKNGMSKALARITPTLEASDFQTAEVIVEAVVENPKVKAIVLAELEDQVTSEAILASNTSTISITRLAEGLKRPENFCGMHFFNPVPVMPLVEVIRGEQTSDETIARTVTYALQLGKKPVVVNDCPAFLVNRVLFPYINAMHLLINDGVDFQQIDKVMEDWGWPMGPAYLSDVVGIDTMCHCLDVLAQDIPERMAFGFESANHVLYANDRLGQKNTLGFYQYEKNDKGRLAKVVDQESYQLLYTQETITTDAREIEERLMGAICLELVRCLEENIVASAAEADMALLWGIGFPKFRGGVLRHIDTVGIEAFCLSIEKYKGVSTMYEMPKLLVEMRAKGERFYP